MAKTGKAFERAVFAFAGTVAPNAKVIFDHHVPDVQVGSPRQCDVWIEATIGGHWPISIYVSCKDNGTRRLDVHHIESFVAEKVSRGASAGLIYSRKGFSDAALKKAVANGVSCCRLYQKEPADIPAALMFEQFGCVSRIELGVSQNIAAKCMTWGDLFRVRLADGTSLLESISECFWKVERETAEEAKLTGFPSNWERITQLNFDGITEPVLLSITGLWRRYRAQLQANILDGSYCISNGSFFGQLIGPSIDTHGPHPGEGWTEIVDPDFTLPPHQIVVILYGADVRTQLEEKLGPVSCLQP